jgi:predicted nucleotidyltransferase
MVIDRIKKAVKKTDPQAVAILYGSRATHKSTKESDWDILILLNKPKVSIKEQNFRHTLYDVELELGEAISTLVYAIPDWNSRLSVTPIYQSIQKTGIVL